MNTAVKLAFPSIEKHEYDKFVHQFELGKYPSMRFGQAFYTHFHLHKVDDQASLHNLYAKDGDHAKRLINQLFNIS